MFRLPMPVGDPEAERNRLAEYLTTNPNDPGGHFMLGAVLLDLKKYEEAIQAFQRGIALCRDVILKATGDQAKALEFMGLAYQKSGSPESVVVACWEKAKELLDALPEVDDAFRSGEWYQELVTMIRTKKHPRS